MRFIKAALSIVRPVNLVITFLVVVLPARAVNAQIEIYILLLAGLSAVFAAAAGNVINDIYDIKIDKVNRPARPLPSGAVSLSSAYIMYRMLIIASLVCAYPLGLLPFAIVCVVHTLLFVYTRALKPIPLAGNVAVSLLTALTFIYSGIISSGVIRMLLPAAFAFLVNLIRELVKDMEDMEGDRRAGITTYPLHYGVKAASWLVIIISCVLIAVTFIPAFWPLLSIWFFIIACIVIDPLIVYAAKMVYLSVDPKSLKRASIALKLSMLCGLAGIVAGL